MSTFQNDASGVVVSVADHKDERFANGWTLVVVKKTSTKAAPKKG
jgi:hypothetical protein